MSMRIPSYHSDPHVTFLSKLLEDIRTGDIQVPKFQRPLVWGWEDRLELFRSIRDGIPMGAVMVWRTSKQELECYKNLGPFKVRPGNSSSQYLLDGVQRLSTLLGALSPISDIDDEADEFLDVDGEPPTENFEVHFDFNLDDFVRSDDLKSSQKGKTLPLSLLLDSVGMLKFQRQLTGSEDEVDTTVEQCDRLGAAFRDYKVPVIPIVTEDVEMATRTFQRLNSQGKAMSEAHMIHALSWGQDFNLNSSIRDAKTAELSDLGWSSLDNDVLLKACKMALNFGVYYKNADEVGRAFKESPGVVEEVGKGCRRAVKLLKDLCGISRPELLPYGFQLILLTNALRVSPKLKEHQKYGLVSWFWSTTYCEYFAGMTGDRVEQARRDLENGLSHDKWNLTSFRPLEVKRLKNIRFDFRTVRAKAFALRLAEGRDDGASLLNRYGRDGLTQLLPRTHSRKILYSSYANRFLVDPNVASNLKEALASGNLDQTRARTILIFPEMLDALKSGDHESFVELREKKIEEVERNFYEPHLYYMNLHSAVRPHRKML